MKKKYTKKQIVEAIKHWQGVLKQMNENIQPHEIDLSWSDADAEKLKILRQKNPYRVSFNYWFEAQNSYGGGLIGATSKEALKQCIKSIAEDYILYDDDLDQKYKTSKPYIFLSKSDHRLLSTKIWALPADNSMFDIDAIVNATANPSQCVGFLCDSSEANSNLEEDQGDTKIIVFEADTMPSYDEYWFEDTTI